MDCYRINAARHGPLLYVQFPLSDHQWQNLACSSHRRTSGTGSLSARSYILSGMMDSAQGIPTGAVIYCSHRLGNVLSGSTPSHTSLASLEMALELWEEPTVIAASIMLLIIARVAYNRNRIIGQPPVVSYAIPWVGSAIDLGKNPDAFFKRAMYVGWLFVRLGAGDDPLPF